MPDLTKKKFTKKDLENLRNEVGKMAITPLKFLGREYYLFIGPKGADIPHQSLHNRLASIWFNLFKRNKINQLAKGKTVRMI